MLSKGKWLGIDPEYVKHVDYCNTPPVVFRHTYSVWQCSCGKKYRIEPQYIGFGETIRVWKAYQK